MNILGPALTDLVGNSTWQQWLGSAECFLLETVFDDNDTVIAHWYKWRHGSRCNFIVYAGHVIIKYCDWHARLLMETLADEETREEWLRICACIDVLVRQQADVWQKMSDALERLPGVDVPVPGQLRLFEDAA